MTDKEIAEKCEREAEAIIEARVKFKNEILHENPFREDYYDRYRKHERELIAQALAAKESRIKELEARHESEIQVNYDKHQKIKDLESKIASLEAELAPYRQTPEEEAEMEAILNMPIEEVNAELRKEGIDPEATVERITLGVARTLKHLKRIEALESKTAELRKLIGVKDAALKGLLDADGGDLRCYRAYSCEEDLKNCDLFVAVPKAIEALQAKEAG